jgi:putative transposase
MKKASYDSCLNDAQWELVSPILPAPCKRGRPRTDRRLVTNAILYVLKTGCQWRMLPVSFPPWKSVFHVFRQWLRSNTLRAVCDRLRALVRMDAGKDSAPTGCVLDSQSVKSDPHGGDVGYDAAKKIKGANAICSWTPLA